jgi:hypothetical protein
MGDTQTGDVALRAGVAQVDITPEAGVQIAGAVCTHRPAQWVMDPLYAKALVVSNGQRKLCFVSADLTIINKKQADRIRDAAAEFGLPREAVMVHATQTHTAPALGRFLLDDDFKGIPTELDWLRGGDDSYDEFAVERIVEAVRLANARLEPVQMAAGRAIEGRVAFNRRAIARDGSAFMPRWQEPLGPVGLCYLEGPIDPELGVMCLRTRDMRMLAVLLHHTCHPVNVFPKLAVSADWPGAWCRQIQPVVGEGCIPLVVNGCCGNVNPWDPFNPDRNGGHERMGNILAGTTTRLLETLDFENTDLLDFASRHVEIPIRPVAPEKLEEARQFLEEHPQVIWTDESKRQADGQWFGAANLLSVDLQRRREGALDYEVQVLRIGDVAIVGRPGEPFVEGQLKIKMASPAKWTLVAHCVNQYVGYIPIRVALQHGGHEVNTSTWAKLAPEALDRIVEAAGELLNFRLATN